MRPWPLKKRETSFPWSASLAIALAETGCADLRVFFIQRNGITVIPDGRRILNARKRFSQECRSGGSNRVVSQPRYNGYQDGSCATTARQRSAKPDPQRLVLAGSAVEPYRPRH